MIIGVPKEIKLQEHRIGLTPNSVKTLCDKGHKVLVESNGGFEAGFTNEDYLKAGAEVLKTPVEIFKQANLPKAPFDIWNYVLKDLIIQNKVTGEKADKLWIDVGSPERLSLAINADKEEN